VVALLRKDKTMIRITSKKDGFRRCGIAHPAKPQEYPNDKFSKKELAVLKADPMLIVDEIPDVSADSRGLINRTPTAVDPIVEPAIEPAAETVITDDKTGKEKTKSKKDK
jgi:hypothetical protein